MKLEDLPEDLKVRNCGNCGRLMTNKPRDAKRYGIRHFGMWVTDRPFCNLCVLDHLAPSTSPDEFRTEGQLHGLRKIRG